MVARKINPIAKAALTEIMRKQRATARRQAVLEPNKDSDVKIESYPFGLAKKVVLGLPCTFTMRDSPDTNFRPQVLTSNAVCPGMFYVQSLQIANICCLIGGHPVDAVTLKDLKIDFPTMTPANRMTAFVRYTGLVPPGGGGPAPTPRAEELIMLLTELRDAEDITWVRSQIDGALRNMPLFEFTIGASGPASICA